MPRVEWTNFGITKKSFITDFVEKYGDLCTAASARSMLGYKSYNGVYSWLKNMEVPEFNINGRRRWLTKEIAKQIWEARTNG